MRRYRVDPISATFSGYALMQGGHRSADDRTRALGSACLHHDRHLVDLVTFNVFERNGPASSGAGPFAEFEPAAHHVVIGDGATMIFTAADGNRNRFR